MSLPTRERGLKDGIIVEGQSASKSLPTRERGLKVWMKKSYIKARVAPYTGAWIERVTPMLPSWRE